MGDEVEEYYIGKELEEHQEILKRLDTLEALNTNTIQLNAAYQETRQIMEKVLRAVEKFDQRQRTIMVGWNSFLEHAGMHLNNLFRGKVPAPLLRKLIEASFRDEPKHAKADDK